MKLSELELITGYQGKGNIGQEYRIITMKDLDRHGNFEYSNLGVTKCDNIKPKYLLRKGDLIIKARGGENTIAIIDKEYHNLLATSHFIIIRIGYEKKLDPYFLHLYLNSEKVKKYMKDELTGSSQQSLKIKSIESIEIPLVYWKKQKELGEMNRIGIQERLKIEEYFNIRDKFFNAKLQQEIKDEGKYYYSINYNECDEYIPYNEYEEIEVVKHGNF